MFNETAILLALSTSSTNRIPLNYSVTIDFPNKKTKKKSKYFAYTQQLHSTLSNNYDPPDEKIHPIYFRSNCRKLITNVRRAEVG